MERRFVSIWFRHLATDWFTIRQRVPVSNNGKSPGDVKDQPFVLRTPSHGRMIISAVNAAAQEKGVEIGMVLADARALLPDLKVLDDKPDLPSRLLRRLAEWCIRFTPIAAVDLPDGLMLDVTGCSHLWGGDAAYLEDIVKKLTARGYDVRVAIADTPGVAWGAARFGKDRIIPCGKNIEALFPLPPEALRLAAETVERLHKLGLHQISQFVKMPRSSIRRRFGTHTVKRLDFASGREAEIIEAVQPPEPYQERLPCLEPI